MLRYMGAVHDSTVIVTTGESSCFYLLQLVTHLLFCYVVCLMCFEHKQELFPPLNNIS
jgi:hypothetical protein